MKRQLDFGARIVLGLIFFVVGGLNGIFQFFTPPSPPPEGVAFLGALMQSGYFLPVLKFTELTGGALLLINVAVPFALVWLAPVTVHIFLFHAMLAPSGIFLPLFMVVLHVYLGTVYWPSFKGLFGKGRTS